MNELTGSLVQSERTSTFAPHGMKDTVRIHAQSILVVPSPVLRSLSRLFPLPSDSGTSMTTFPAATDKRLDTALLVIRLVLAAVFITHGYQKVFGMGISGVTGMFTKMGVPLPGVTAPLVAVVELLGGIALVLGAFTRVAAFLLACDMLGAIILVHARNGYSAPKGVETVLGNLGMAVALALVGAGAYSIDALLSRRNSATP